MINKLKKAARSLVALRQIVSNEIIFKAIKKDLHPEFSGKLNGSRILILSPHPDDEVIGCAGAIIKCVESQGEVKVMHFTDGSGGFPEDFKPTRAERIEMAKKREEEAEKVKDFLAISDVVFLKYKDSSLTPTKNLINYLTQQIKNYKPDVIFVPSSLDTNQDHFETARTFYLASKNLPPNTTIMQYDVWSPTFANYYLDIDKEINSKLDAIKIYQSQIQSRDYSKAIEGLNRYRGTIYGKSKYAEAYLKTDLKTFQTLAKLVF